MTKSQTQATHPQTTYAKRDLVVFRDAERYWLGKSGHTFVGRVERSWRDVDSGKVLYDVIELSGYRYVGGIDPDYMRLLPPTDAMTDIDNAPLSVPDAGAMTPAAVAWLRQHLAESSTLPATS